MTEAFLKGLKQGKPPPIPIQQKRRLFFIGGGLLGILLSYLVFVSTAQYHGSVFKELESTLGGMEFGFPSASFGGGWDSIANMLNMSDLISPTARTWLENRDFKVHRYHILYAA